jgi:hypothetical protein
VRTSRHGNVEIFWGFRSDSPAVNNNRHQVGMGARRSDVGLGYRVAPAEATNDRLRIRYVPSWGASGGVIEQTATGNKITPGADYYCRFMLVGTTLSAKYWAVGAAETGLDAHDHPLRAAAVCTTVWSMASRCPRPTGIGR